MAQVTSSGRLETVSSSPTTSAWVNERLHVGCAIFEGDRGVLDCLDTIRDLAGQYTVAEVIYDPWRFGQAAQELEREGLIMEKFPQNDTQMVPASNTLHAAITGGARAGTSLRVGRPLH